VLEVHRGWKFPVDCVEFWSSNYQDETADKVMLMQKISQLLCFKCAPPKVKC
jgi:hypothetical protein